MPGFGGNGRSRTAPQHASRFALARAPCAASPGSLTCSPPSPVATPTPVSLHIERSHNPGPNNRQGSAKQNRDSLHANIIPAGQASTHSIPGVSKRIQESSPIADQDTGRQRISKMKPSFSDLPEELLVHILAHFGCAEGEELGWEDRVALCNISLTSKRLCRIAQPLLYRGPCGPLGCIGHGPTRSKFLNAIFDRPDLAKLVKEVHLVYDQYRNSVAPDLQHGSALKTLDERVVVAVRRLNFPYQDAFLFALQEEHYSAEVALLLSQLPNLESLTVRLETEWLEQYKWVVRLLRHRAAASSTSNPSDPFSSLKSLNVYGSDSQVTGGTTPYDPQFVNDFLTLPSLRTIKLVDSISDSTVESQTGSTVKNILWNAQEGSSNLEKIVLENSLVDNTFIENILRACKDPKTFTYRFGRGSINEGLIWDDFVQTLDALKVRKDSLETIELDLTLLPHGFFESLFISGDGNPGIGSFEEFLKLRELAIPGRLIYGIPRLDWSQFDGVHWPDVSADDTYPDPSVDIFPASLERLTIDCEGLEGDVQFILPFLRKFAEGCSQRLPNLCFVRLIVHLYYQVPFVSHISRDLEGLGIEVRVDFRSPWDDKQEGRLAMSTNYLKEAWRTWGGLFARNGLAPTRMF